MNSYSKTTAEEAFSTDNLSHINHLQCKLTESEELINEALDKITALQADMHVEESILFAVNLKKKLILKKMRQLKLVANSSEL